MFNTLLKNRFLQLVVLVQITLVQSIADFARHNDDMFYGNCSTAANIPGQRIKCVGYPIGCIEKRTCIWAGSVTDDGKELITKLFDRTRNVLDSQADPDKWPVQSFDAWGLATLDETMTIVECREPQIEDAKFFFLFNDTSYFRSPNATSPQGSYSITSTYVDKARHLQKCNGVAESIPESQNPKYKFNLRFFLENFLLVYSGTKFYEAPYQYADSIDYNIDGSKMLYYSGPKFQELSSGSGTKHLFTMAIVVPIITAAVCTFNRLF